MKYKPIIVKEEYLAYRSIFPYMFYRYGENNRFEVFNHLKNMPIGWRGSAFKSYDSMIETTFGQGFQYKVLVRYKDTWCEPMIEDNIYGG